MKLTNAAALVKTPIIKTVKVAPKLDQKAITVTNESKQTTYTLEQVSALLHMERERLLSGQV